MSWKPSQIQRGVAIYNFDSRHPHELSLEVGDVVFISEDCFPHGWYRGYCLRNKNDVGIFPSSFVHVKHVSLGEDSQHAPGRGEPVVEEVADVLRVWGDMLKESYVDLKDRVVQRLNSSMTLLVKWRRDILHSSLRSDQLLRLKMKIASAIDQCNSQLGMDVVPRNDTFDPVDVDNTSVLDLYNIHAKHRTTEGKASTARFVHLYAQVSSVSCQVASEDTDLLFSLYDASEQKFISERVLVRSGPDGSYRSLGCDKKVFLDWLFTELDPSLLARLSDVHIVCHVLRLGRMDLNVKKPTTSIFRRPVGVVMLPLAKLRTVVDEPGTLVQVSSFMHPVSDDKDFSTLHETVIRKGKGNERTGIVALNLRLVYGELREAQEFHQEVLSKETPIVRKLGFAAFTLPGEVRNDIFITLEGGDFEKGNKTSAKNIEVTSKLLDMSGKPLDMIHQSATSSPTSEVQSVILYHNNNPRWGETFRLNIPLHQIGDAVLVFHVRHCSSSSDSRAADKQSVFAYLKLVRKDGTTISNGLLDMCVYKFTPECHTPSTFTAVASTAKDLLQDPITTPLVLSRKEGFSVRVEVCSTKLTQDHRLLALLRWRLHQDQLVEVLEGVMKMDGRDVCLFMQDAFDALFNILDIDNKLCSQLVFNALVHFLGFLLKPEYEQFVETLETYIHIHFSGAMAYRKLLTGLRGYIENAHRQELHRALMNTTQTFHFILKIIIQSRNLHARATKISNADTSFKESLEKVIHSVISLIKLPDENLQPVQRAALKSLGNSVEIFRPVFGDVELAKVLSLPIEAIPANVPDHPLIESKLAYMLVLTNHELFSIRGARQNLLAPMLTHAGTYLSSKDQLDAVYNIIGRVVARLESKVCTAEYEDKLQLSMILPTLVPHVAEMTRSPKVSRSMYMALCSLLGILRLMDGDIYAELLPTVADWITFVKQLFTIFRLLLDGDIFDKSWSSIRLIMHHVILVSISLLADVLQPKDGAQFNLELMSIYFSLATKFITQPLLQLESLHKLRASQLEARFGDMRYVMATELVVMWSVLGDGRNRFVPFLVEPLLRAAVVKQQEARRAILPVFVDMLELDFAQEKSVKRVAGELFHALDPVVSNGGGDYDFLRELQEIWLQRTAESKTMPDQLRAVIRSLVERIVKLGTLLFDYRSLGREDLTSSDRRSRMLVLYNLASFYKEHGPAKLYDASLYTLAGLHIFEKSWTEAAFTLLRLSETLDFQGKATLDAVLEYPEQSSAARKEALLQEMVKYFGHGKAFECGIEQCDKLVTWYRHRVFDFPKLRSILEVQASYFGSIVSELRAAREYFRVGFYGQGFPPYLRNKAFVYRGVEYEKLGSFQDRILLDHNNIELMKTNQLPGEEVTSSGKRYLQICTVKPCGVVMEQLESPDVNERIRDYYRVNNVTRFEYSRPYHVGVKDKENEFKTLWLERTSVTIAWPLPGILQWSEVVNTEVCAV